MSDTMPTSTSAAYANSSTSTPYWIGNIPNVWNGGQFYSGNSVGELLSKFDNHPKDLTATYVWISGDTSNTASPNVMKRQIARAFSAAGGSRGSLFKSYPTPGSFDITTGKPRVAASDPNSVVGSGDALSQMSATAQYSAAQTIDNYLHDWGLTSLSGWAWDQISAAGNYKSAAGVLQEMRKTPEYQARFPGQAERAANGLAPIKEENYIRFEDGAKELASQYGLPNGFMSADEIAKLVGHGVSLIETQDRIVNGYRQMHNADKATKQTLRDYYGVHGGHLAAYYLNPKRAYDLLMKQTQSAEIGGIMKDEGVGGIKKGIAEQLSKQMTGSPGSMDLGAIRAGAQRIAPLVGLEQSQMGQRGQATVTQNQLLGSQFGLLNKKTGNTAAGNQQAIQLAAQARVAGFEGGGGFAKNTQGGAAVGSASSAGTGK